MQRHHLWLLGLGAVILGINGGISTVAVADPPVPTCDGMPATLIGSAEQRLRGTSGDDVIVTEGAPVVRSVRGDDVICVTGRTEAVYAGAGNDYVDTTDGQTRAWTDLGRGADVFNGGARRDRVTAGPGTDIIGTGDGPDTYYDHGEVVAEGSDDLVRLGNGDDRAVVVAPNLDGSLDGGSGRNDLRVDVWSDDAPHAWVVDNADQAASRDGSAFLEWTDFTRFRLLPGHGTLEFQGSGEDETVAVFEELGAGLVPTVDLAGGDDRVLLGGRTGPVDGGDGNDSMRLSFADERRPELADPLRADLTEQELRIGDGSSTPLVSTENVSAEGFVEVDLVGDDHANRLTAARACDVRMVGGRGDDALATRAEVGCPDSYGVPPQARLEGNLGADHLVARGTDDVLLGGRGDDEADGRGGSDVCAAEVRTSCEVGVDGR